MATFQCSGANLRWPCDVGDGWARDGVEVHRPCCGGTSVRIQPDVYPSVRDVHLVHSLCPTLVALASSFLKMQFFNFEKDDFHLFNLQFFNFENDDFNF